MFAGLENASAQQEDSSLKRKAELDIQRLELEITKLEKEALSLPGGSRVLSQGFSWVLWVPPPQFGWIVEDVRAR